MKQKRKKEGNPRRKIIFTAQTSALLVIDMQQYFCDPSSHAFFKDSTKIVPHIQQLISAYRQRGLPVVFTRYALLRTEDPGSMGRWWNDVLYDDNKMASLVESLRPLSHEPVIRKTQYSAFYETSLETILQKHRVSAVVITGVLTHLCCETTARDAFMRNYDVFLVTDATASDSTRFHTASLTTLSDGFATLTTTQEVCGWVNNATSR